jgi:predicted  nucleic acid-binding Zn-ribbon protein
VAISSETLKAERDALKETLREVEAEQRRLEADLKAVRQRELRTKREIEALTTLLDLTCDESSRSEAG